MRTAKLALHLIYWPFNSEITKFKVGFTEVVKLVPQSIYMLINQVIMKESVANLAVISTN